MISVSLPAHSWDWRINTYLMAGVIGYTFANFFGLIMMTRMTMINILHLQIRVCHPARADLPPLPLRRLVVEGVPHVPVLRRLALPPPLHGPLRPQRLEEAGRVEGLHLPRRGAAGPLPARHHHPAQGPSSSPLCRCKADGNPPRGKLLKQDNFSCCCNNCSLTTKAFSDGILKVQRSEMEPCKSLSFDLWHSQMESFLILIFSKLLHDGSLYSYFCCTRHSEMESINIVIFCMM